MKESDDPHRTASISEPNLHSVTVDLKGAVNGIDGLPTEGLPSILPCQAEGLPVVPGFILVAEIGRGGMGVVYRAIDTSLRRDVAIKILQQRYHTTDAAVRRFVEESQITAQLQHPGIPSIHIVGSLEDGRPFLAMKLIKGETLDQLFKQRAAPDEQTDRYLTIFEHICQAVGYAHDREIVHRDIKPANIMVGAFGEVQVMDWGLAKSLRDPNATKEDRSEIHGTIHTEIGSDRDDESVTQTGSVLGTPAYMPPEQAGGEIAKIDCRSDVFSLGAVLCVLLTGQPPYLGDRVDALRLMAVRADLQDAFRRLDSCRAEPELIVLCKRCLSMNRDDRPADANEVAAAVAAFRATVVERTRKREHDRVRIEAETRERRKVQLALVITMVLLLTVGGGFLWFMNRQSGKPLLRDLRAEADRLGGNIEPQHKADGLKDNNTLRDQKADPGAIGASKKTNPLKPKNEEASQQQQIKTDALPETQVDRRSITIKLDPDNRVNAANYLRLGDSLQSEGNWVDAIAAYKEAVQFAPEDPIPYFLLKVIYLQQKKYPEAIACARAALRLDPKSANSHAMLGDALFRSGDIIGARTALTEAVRLDPEWKPLLLKLPSIEQIPAPHEVR